MRKGMWKKGLTVAMAAAMLAGPVSGQQYLTMAWRLLKQMKQIRDKMSMC